MKYLKIFIYSTSFIVITFVSGIAIAQARTEVDIIPSVTFFEDDQLISFSYEELENFNEFILEPLSIDFALSSPDTTTTTTTTSIPTNSDDDLDDDSDDDDSDDDDSDDDDSDDD